ncbi:hypothetical protein WA158_004083 [Blastocystis sp. Blastoise]
MKRYSELSDDDVSLETLGKMNEVDQHQFLNAHKLQSDLSNVESLLSNSLGHIQKRSKKERSIGINMIRRSIDIVHNDAEEQKQLTNTITESYSDKLSKSYESKNNNLEINQDSNRDNLLFQYPFSDSNCMILYYPLLIYIYIIAPDNDLYSSFNYPSSHTSFDFSSLPYETSSPIYNHQDLNSFSFSNTLSDFTSFPPLPRESFDASSSLVEKSLPSYTFNSDINQTTSKNQIQNNNSSKETELSSTMNSLPLFPLYSSSSLYTPLQDPLNTLPSNTSSFPNGKQSKTQNEKEVLITSKESPQLSSLLFPSSSISPPLNNNSDFFSSYPSISSRNQDPINNNKENLLSIDNTTSKDSSNSQEFQKRTSFNNINDNIQIHNLPTIQYTTHDPVNSTSLISFTHNIPKDSLQQNTQLYDPLQSPKDLELSTSNIKTTSILTNKQNTKNSKKLSTQQEQSSYTMKYKDSSNLPLYTQGNPQNIYSQNTPPKQKSSYIQQNESPLNVRHLLLHTSETKDYSNYINNPLDTSSTQNISIKSITNNNKDNNVNDKQNNVNNINSNYITSLQGTNRTITNSKTNKNMNETNFFMSPKGYVDLRSTVERVLSQPFDIVPSLSRPPKHHSLRLLPKEDSDEEYQLHSKSTGHKAFSMFKRDGTVLKWCHQCKARKRDVIDCKNCGKNRHGSGNRCVRSYCRKCLYKHYNLNIDELRKLKDGWLCPGCQDKCSCAACIRKRYKDPRDIPEEMQQKRNSRFFSTNKKLLQQLDNNVQAT